MSIDPVIPDYWDGFKMSYRHGEAVYEIQVENPKHVENGVESIKLDGKPLEVNSIPLLKDFAKHKVIVVMGNRKF